MEVETIFDHSVTEAEQITLYGFVQNQNEYISANRANGAWLSIAKLYHIRKQPAKSEEYLAKLSKEFYDATFEFDVIGSKRDLAFL